MVLPSKLYDILKWATMVGLPAFAVLYNALASVWGLPYAAEIQATIMAIVVFMGAILQISSSNFRANQVIENSNKMLEIDGE